MSESESEPLKSAQREDASAAAAAAAKQRKCPSCQRSFVADPSAPYRPFCSRRCQLADLGKWFDEAYRVSRPLGPDEQL